MPRVSTYLNFSRSTEKAFVFYQSVFGREFAGPIHRFGAVPAAPGQPPLAESDKKPRHATSNSQSLAAMF